VISPWSSAAVSMVPFWSREYGTPADGSVQPIARITPVPRSSQAPSSWFVPATGYRGLVAAAEYAAPAWDAGETRIKVTGG
jgi:hypothetical protein